VVCNPVALYMPLGRLPPPVPLKLERPRSIFEDLTTGCRRPPVAGNPRDFDGYLLTSTPTPAAPRLPTTGQHFCAPGGPENFSGRVGVRGMREPSRGVRSPRLRQAGRPLRGGLWGDSARRGPDFVPGPRRGPNLASNPCGPRPAGPIPSDGGAGFDSQMIAKRAGIPEETDPPDGEQTQYIVVCGR